MFLVHSASGEMGECMFLGLFPFAIQAVDVVILGGTGDPGNHGEAQQEGQQASVM